MKAAAIPLLLALIAGALPSAESAAEDTKTGVDGRSAAADSARATADSRAVEQRLDRLETNWARLESELAELRAALQSLGAGQAASAATPGGSAAISDNVDQRLSAVETYAQSLRGELEQVKTTVTAQDQALSANSDAQSRALSLSSYGNFIVSDRSNADTVFDAESFEIVLSGQPHDRIGFFSELEFERAATVGGDRGGEVLLEQAYVDFSLSDQLALRSGVLLMPFGNVAADHYAPLRDTISKSLSSYAIVPSDWTDNGFGLVGDASLSDNWHLNYETYLVSGLAADIDALGLRRARQGFGVDNNADKSFIAHLGLSRDTLVLGLAGYHGAYDDAGNLALDGLGLDFTWNPTPFKLTGELLRMQADRNAASDAILWGGYVRGNYDVSTWLPGFFAGNSFPDARLSLIYQYDYANIDDVNSTSNASRSEWQHTLGFKYEPLRSWIFKLNYEVSRAGRLPIRNGDGHAILMAIGYVF